MIFVLKWLTQCRSSGVTTSSQSEATIKTRWPMRGLCWLSVGAGEWKCEQGGSVVTRHHLQMVRIPDRLALVTKSRRDYDYDISDKLLLLMLNCSWPMCWKNMAFTTLPKWSYRVKLIQRVGNDRAGDASTRRHGGLRVRSVEHENDNRGADSASLLNMGHWLSIPISIVKCQLKSFLSLEMKDIILNGLRDFLLPGLTVLE